MNKPPPTDPLTRATELEPVDNDDQHPIRRALKPGDRMVSTATHNASAVRQTLPSTLSPRLTQHGRARLQQRGISMDQVLTVMAFGTEQRTHGASRYFFDKRSRARLAEEMPDLLRELDRLDIHVVVSDDDCLITAAHRTKRLRRDISSRAKRKTLH